MRRFARCWRAVGVGLDGVSLATAWTGSPIESRTNLFYGYGGFGIPGKSPRPVSTAAGEPSIELDAKRAEK